MKAQGFPCACCFDGLKADRKLLRGPVRRSEGMEAASIALRSNVRKELSGGGDRLVPI